MSAWDTVRTVVGEMFEAVNLTSANEFSETPMGLEIRELPNPRFNGAYSIALDGIPQVEREVGATIVALMNVRIQVGFIVNQQEALNPDTEVLENPKTDYTNAAKDILLILKTMLLTTYSTLEVKRHIGTSGLRALNDTENYFVCDITFQLGAREA